MPSAPSSALSTLVRPLSACLEATYAPSPARPTVLMMEPTLTMRPHWRCRMCTAHSRASTAGPSRLQSKTRCTSAMSSSSKVARLLMPALLTSTSMRPWSRTISATAAQHACGSPTSKAIVDTCACGFLCKRAARASASVAGFVPPKTTVAPRSAKPAANSNPIPREAPVTSATRPSSLNSFSVRVRSGPGDTSSAACACAKADLDPTLPNVSNRDASSAI
mmetsp:Transcript_11391/g.24629  ORF Transcript_11391/g.24629 Transcript_11391/m.24629 type:complete len:221 (-) Transcript_11391:274-936(-)